MMRCKAYLQKGDPASKGHRICHLYNVYYIQISLVSLCTKAFWGQTGLETTFPPIAPNAYTTSHFSCSPKVWIHKSLHRTFFFFKFSRIHCLLFQNCSCHLPFHLCALSIMSHKILLIFCAFFVCPSYVLKQSQNNQLIQEILR